MTINWTPGAGHAPDLIGPPFDPTSVDLEPRVVTGYRSGSRPAVR